MRIITFSFIFAVEFNILFIISLNKNRMKNILLGISILISALGFSQTIAQDTTATKNNQKNAAQNILSGNITTLYN